MNHVLSFLTGPIVGAIIGLITNGIAIRMLFRPLHPVKVFGHTLPFTPGIIPKEKTRISKACGDVVGEILINKEVLAANLLSEEMDQKILDVMENTVGNYKDSTMTIQDVLYKAFDESKTATFISDTQSAMANAIYSSVQTMAIGSAVADAAMTEIQKNPLYGTFSFMITNDAVSGMKGRIKGMVDEMIADKGLEMINGVVVSESEHLLDLTIAEIYERYGYRVPAVETFILGSYHQLVENTLARILEAINLSKLVEDRINSFDVLEMEHILLSIMKKELSAIIWLGGLLGLIMGFVMNFF